jgi:aspartate oxidase
LTQGNIFQGELSLEQLFFLRPVAGWAYYRTPVDGLYMCGSATHPGGGIMGANGRIASQVMLKDWKKVARAAKSGGSKSNGSKSHDTKSHDTTSSGSGGGPVPATSSPVSSQKVSH